jgi:hypothetical protein
LSLHQFQELYNADPFYAWFGLNHPLVYAAHKAAGGITSVYRQIGLGSEELFRQILQDQLVLDKSQTSWSYRVRSSSGKGRTLKLDGRIRLDDVADAAQRERIASWLYQATVQLDVAPPIAQALQGAVFEVRQGYKSKDSKRQNADLANAASAYTQGYLPAVVVFSTQIDHDIAARYEHEKWLVLRGTRIGSATQSAYTFVRDVIGYDLPVFFERHSATIKAVVEDVLQTLLSSYD